MTTFTLVLLRHGIAEERQTWKGADAERPLTSAGVKRVRRAARAFERLGLEFEAIWSSPYERALATARLVGEHRPYKHAPLDSSETLTPDQDPHKALETLLDRVAEDAVVLWVGHEPHLGRTVERLALGGRPTGRFALRKGGACALEITRRGEQWSGELLWMLSPRLLTRIEKMK